MNPPKRCPSCKGKEFQELRQKDEREVAGYTFGAELKVYQCLSCPESLFALSEVGKFDLEIAGWLARQGVLSGEAFRFMRKAIGLRAKEVAQLLDLTPETVSRWEKERRLPDRKAMMVMGTLVLDRLNGEDITLKRLRTLGSSPQENAPIDLTESLRAA